jgi:steroid delta-isomerase-like uncharacterized protein
MTPEQNKDIIRRYFAAQNEHNLDAAFAFLRSDMQSHNVPGTTGPQGIETARGFFTMMHEAIDGLQTTIHDLIAEGDRVVVRFTVSGTQTGEFMGQPASGQPIAWNLITIYRLEDGKIAEVWS